MRSGLLRSSISMVEKKEKNNKKTKTDENNKKNGKRNPKWELAQRKPDSISNIEKTFHITQCSSENE